MRVGSILVACATSKCWTAVQVGEDQSRLRVKHGAENFSRLRRIALNKLKRWQIRKPNGKVIQAGLRLKQQSGGWSRKFLLEVLLA
jgi:hypothetical protein